MHNKSVIFTLYIPNGTFFFPSWETGHHQFMWASCIHINGNGMGYGSLYGGGVGGDIALYGRLVVG